MKVMLDKDLGAMAPTRAHLTDAGLDLYSTENVVIWPFTRKTVNTGVHVAVPENCMGLVASKSGLMGKSGITCRGIIDEEYTGSIKAVLFNHSWKFVKVKKGQKITQLIIVPILKPAVELVESLEDTKRGDGGFGSTGK